MVPQRTSYRLPQARASCPKTGQFLPTSRQWTLQHYRRSPYCFIKSIKKMVLPLRYIFCRDWHIQLIAHPTEKLGNVIVNARSISWFCVSQAGQCTERNLYIISVRRVLDQRSEGMEKPKGLFIVLAEGKYCLTQSASCWPETSTAAALHSAAGDVLISPWEVFFSNSSWSSRKSAGWPSSTYFLKMKNDIIAFF